MLKNHINCRRRMGLKDRLLIVKRAVKTALDPKTKSFLYVIQQVDNDKLLLGHVWDADLVDSKTNLDVIAQWLVQLYAERCNTLDELQGPLRGFIVSMWQQWELKKKTGIDIVMPVHLLVDKSTVPPEQIKEA